MRLSSNSIFLAGVSQLGTLQSAIAKTQNQLATNRRVVTAADDPIASARALEVTQSQSINTQFVTNRSNARASLSQVELALQGTTGLIQDVQDLATNAGNGTLSATDRNSLATELQGRLDDLLGLANSSDGAGGYLFSGYKSTTLPFTQTATGAQYNGDQGQRQLQVGSSRQVPISDSGSSVFENNVTGNGTFTTRQGTNVGGGQNTGSGIVSTGAVTDAAAVTGHKYTVAFQVTGTPAATTYTINDDTTGLPVPGPGVTQVPFQSGQQITFDGVAFDIKGAPADGDQFQVAPSQKQSIFTTITDLLAALKAGSGGGSTSNASATLTNALNTAHDNLTSSLDNVLSVRASIGSRLKELDSLDSSGDDLNVQYEATLSNLTGLDLTKAISDYSQQQLTLDAAQKSFKVLSGLSLFNYLP
jgi:flagellar hook-associated protein 3 FlgL